MANLQYIRQNALREVARSEAGKRLWIYGILALAAVALAVVTELPFLLLAFLAAIAGIELTSRSRKSSQGTVQGAAAEEKVVDGLSDLPDHFYLRNQVRVPNPKSRTGNTELDLVVVGRGAIFNIEVKANEGMIIPLGNEKEWAVRYGPRRMGKIRNPARQARYQMFTLLDRLKEVGYPRPVYPMVFFVNNDRGIKTREGLDVPVFFLLHEVKRYIMEKDAEHMPLPQDNVNNAISQLEDQVRVDAGQPVAAASGREAA